MFVKLNILALICFCVYSFSNAALEFGTFDLLITDFQQCNGPKRRDCCNITASVTQLRKLDYHLTVLENVKATKGKIVATSQGKDNLRLQLKNPCDHLFLRPLFQSIMNVTKDCVIQKGYYHFYLDILDVAKKYYSGSFIYGQWKFMSVFYNDYCNFSCSKIVVDIVPKNKTKLTT